MTMPFGEKAAVIGGRKATQQITVLASGAPAAAPSPGGDYLTRLLADALYAPVAHSHPWSQITSKPTTLGGYGITDAQPASAELTAIAGLSSPGYVKRTGPGAYSVVASIPQADVAGGPFLPLAAGAANVLTGPVYSGGSLANIPAAPLNLVNGAQGVMKTQLNLVNTAGFPGAGSAIDFFTYDQAGGTLPGVRIGAVDDNWSASFSVWTKTPGAASNPLVERLKISNAGLVTLSSLGAGFVRSSSAGLLSSSALAAADIPSLDASKITTGTFADARIASSATWNAKLSTVTADATSRAARTFYAAPSGAAGTATFRAIVAADIPTLNQNTTGSSAKWTTARTVTIGSTGKAVDGSSNVSWSLAEIGAFALAGGTLNSGAQILTSKDITPSASPNTNYLLAPIVAQRSSNSGTTTVAAVGFHNVGVNAAALYYDAAASIFRYNRHTGDIVTIWDTSNLSSGTLPGGPYLPLASGSVHAPGSYTVSSPTLGIGDAQYGLSAHGGNLYLWSAPAGQVVSAQNFASLGAVAATTSLAWGGGILRDHYVDPNYFALYGAWVGSYGNNYTVAASKDGQISWLGGSVSSGLAVAGQAKLTAYSGYIQPSVSLYMPDLNIWGTARSGDGGRWMHYMGGGTGGVGTGTSNALIQRYQYGGFDGFVVGNAEFYGITQDHQYGGPGAQLSIVAGAAVGRISFFAGLPTLQASGKYQAPRVGDWTNSGLSIIGELYASTKITAGPAQMSQWVVSGDFARFGHSSRNLSSGFGYMQQSNGDVFLEAPTGGTVQLRISGLDVVRINGAGSVVTGTLSASGSLAWGGGGAIGSSNNVVQGYNGSGNSSINGAVAMSSWRRSGFYAFSNPTDAPNSSNSWTHLIHSQGADWASGSHYTFQIASSFSGGNNQFWGSEIYAMRVVTGGTPQPWRRLFFDRDGIIDTGTQLDFVPAGGTTYGMRITRSSGNPYVAFPFGFTATGVTINTATFGSDGYNPAISSPDAAIGGMKQVASRFWSTSSVLPVMAANTWCFLVCDFTGGTNVMWTTNSSQTVSIRSGGTTYLTAVNSTLTDGGSNFYANYRTMILIGPTVSSSSQCSVIVW